MPRLRRYIHGQGYYIFGQVPGIGFCTWQIGKEGIEYLEKRGVSRDGDSVSPGDLRELHERRLVWTGGKGPGPITIGLYKSWRICYDGLHELHPKTARAFAPGRL